MSATKLLYTAYFTDEMCDAIRNGRYHKDMWTNYVVYHKSKGVFDPKIAIDTLWEFHDVVRELTCDIQLSPADFQRFLTLKNIEEA